MSDSNYVSVVSFVSCVANQKTKTCPSSTIKSLEIAY